MDRIEPSTLTLFLIDFAGNSTVQLVMCISLSSIFVREGYAVQHFNSSTLALVNQSEGKGSELD